MKLRPMNDNVLIQRITGEETSPGGIILTARERQPGDIDRGKVLAVGPGRVLPNGKLSPMSVKEGDVVWLPPVFTGLDKAAQGRTSVVKEGQMLLRDPEILAVEEG